MDGLFLCLRIKHPLLQNATFVVSYPYHILAGVFSSRRCLHEPSRVKRQEWLSCEIG